MGVIKGIARVVGIPARPSGTEVAKGHNLEILNELHVDGSVGEIAEHGEAQFAVQDHKVVAVADVLLEAAHVGGQSLIGIVLRVVDRCALIEGGEDPVVDAAHVVDELLLTE